jgi:hypothetical protein
MNSLKGFVGVVLTPFAYDDYESRSTDFTYRLIVDELLRVVRLEAAA